MKYQITRIVDALQYTGVESVPAIQAFVAPSSPLFNHQAPVTHVKLALDLPDPLEDSKWPSSAPHFKLTFIAKGDWIVKDAAGRLDVIAGAAFEAGAVPVVDAPVAEPEIPPAAPLEHLDVAAEIAATNAQDVIDPDPTIPVDASAAQASPAAATLREPWDGPEF